MRTYQTTPLSSRIRVTRSPTSSTVPVAGAGVDDVADAVLVLEDHEDAGEEVLDQALRAEAERDADDAGAGDDRRDVTPSDRRTRTNASDEDDERRDALEQAADRPGPLAQPGDRGRVAQPIGVRRAGARRAAA